MSDIDSYLDDLEKQLINDNDNNVAEEVEDEMVYDEENPEECIDGVNNDEDANNDNDNDDNVDDDDAEFQNEIMDILNDDDIDDDELEDGTIFMDAEGNYYYQSGKKAVPVKPVKPVKRKRSAKVYKEENQNQEKDEEEDSQAVAKKRKSSRILNSSKTRVEPKINSIKPMSVAHKTSPMKTVSSNLKSENTKTKSLLNKSNSQTEETKLNSKLNIAKNSSVRINRSIKTEPEIKIEKWDITTITESNDNMTITSETVNDEEIFEFEETERNFEDDPDDPDYTMEDTLAEEKTRGTKIVRETRALLKPLTPRKSNLKPNASGEFQCSTCSYSTDKKFLLTRHLKTHSDERPFQCSVCERGFKTNVSLINHINTHLGNKPHQCTDCEKTFTTSGELTRHRRYRHTGIKPHKCTECDYASVELSKLKRHMCCHTGERPYQCPHCTYASPDTFKLKRHMRTHTGEKPYECDICHSRFTQSNSLKYHRLIHSVNDKPVFQCKLCPTTCGRKTDLRLHIQKQHNTDNPVTCKRCGKVLPDRYSYKMHVKTHEGEKCFRCQLCPYASISQRHLDTHMLLHTDSKPFKCELCDQSFRQKQLLNRHIKIYHTANYVPPLPKKKAHSCPHCDRSFAFNGNLIRHMEVHDPNSIQNEEKLKLKLGRMKRVLPDGTIVNKIKTPFIYTDEDEEGNNDEIEDDELAIEEDEEAEEEVEDEEEVGKITQDEEEAQYYTEENEDNIQYVYEEYVNDDEQVEHDLITEDKTILPSKHEKHQNSPIVMETLLTYGNVKKEQNEMVPVQMGNGEEEDHGFMVIEVLPEEDEDEGELETYATLQVEQPTKPMMTSKETVTRSNEKTSNSKTLGDITDCFGFDDDAEADEVEDDPENELIQILAEE